MTMNSHGRGAPGTWKLVLSYIGLIALLAVDRYSYGYPGGEAYLREYPWQTVVVSMLLVLISLGMLFALRGRWEYARRTFLVEGATFISLNVIYLLRDGLDRLVWGYEHSPMGLVALLGGLSVRIWLYKRINRPIAQDQVAAP